MFRHLMKFSDRRGYIDRESYVTQYLALAIFITGIVSTLGSDDLLAAFAAGPFLYNHVCRSRVAEILDRKRNFMGRRVQHAHRRRIFCSRHRLHLELWLLCLHRSLATLQILFNARAWNNAMEFISTILWDRYSATYTCYFGAL